MEDLLRAVSSSNSPPRLSAVHYTRCRDALLSGEPRSAVPGFILQCVSIYKFYDFINLYDADPARVEVVHPGVDLSVFRPVGQAEARVRLGLPAGAHVLLFAGRIQPLKAPDVLLRAVASLVSRDPSLRPRLVVPVVGGPSGTGLEHPESLALLAQSLGIDDIVRFVPPVAQSALANWYAAATLVCVPSYNESFGLVAVEAQAVRPAVVAAAVGGLTTDEPDGVCGILVDGHDAEEYARVIERIIAQPELRSRLAAGAVEQASNFAWERTADRTLEVYRQASAAMRRDIDADLQGTRP